MRTLYRTPEFDEFYEALDERVKTKFKYTFEVVQTVYALPVKYVKHLEGTDLYEMRVSVGYIKRLRVMIKLDESKLAKLKTASQLLDEEYGKEGTPSRTEFNEKAMAWYYGEILRDRRKELKMTQKQLAQKIGKEQSYIARVEKGEVDMQLSSFFRIARALNIELTPSFI